MDKYLLTVPETAEATGLSRSKTYELIASGAIKSVMIGRSRRVPVSALEDFLNDLSAK